MFLKSIQTYKPKKMKKNSNCKLIILSIPPILILKLNKKIKMFNKIILNTFLWSLKNPLLIEIEAWLKINNNLTKKRIK